jgi:hypothetical protein
MKILVDPAISVLIKDFTDAQCAELLRCIFEYPNRDCELGVWQYLKKQIQADEQKYKDKCKRAANVRKIRQRMRSEMISNMKSNMNSEMISKVEEVEEERKINKNKINEFKRSERRNAPAPVENSVENVLEFFIDENFSFEKVIERNQKFKDYLALFPASVIENAEQTFKKKRKGQWANIRQILEWIEKQHLFYKNNQGV